MRPLNDRRGLVAIFDALVFLVASVLLSVGLLVASTLVAREAATTGEEHVIRYAADTLRAFLESTLPEVTFRDVDGAEIVRPPGTTAAGFLIVEDLAIRDEGAPAANVADLEHNLTRQLESVVRGDLGFLLEARYGMHAIYLPVGQDRGDLPGRTYAATQELTMAYGKSGEASVVLWLWPVA